VAAISREERRPASRASMIWLAAQIKISASQIVAMPCSIVPSTRTVTLRVRKSMGVVRLLLESEKKG
jgi:hypothetical protein